MSPNYPEPVVFDAKGEHTATVIFSHGLGETARGWAVNIEGWRRNAGLDGVKWVLPNAPTRSLTAVRHLATSRPPCPP